MTTLVQMTASQSAKFALFNENFAAVTSAAAFGYKVGTTSGLDWGSYGGVVWANGAWHTLANDEITCIASNTNYIALDLEGDGTTPALTINQSGFTAGEIPIVEVVCDGSGITGQTDRRVMYNFAPQGNDIQIFAFADPITPDALAGEIVSIGALTAVIVIGAPTNPFLGAKLTFLFLQDGTGSFGITWNGAFKKSSDPTAGTSNQQGSISFVYDGNEWIQSGGPLIWF